VYDAPPTAERRIHFTPAPLEFLPLAARCQVPSPARSFASSNRIRLFHIPASRQSHGRRQHIMLEPQRIPTGNQS
jgi:hypothetical protein